MQTIDFLNFVYFFKWNYRFVNFVLWFVIRIHRFLQIVYFCIWNYGFSKNCIVFLYESVDFVQTFFRVFDENHRFSNLLYGFVLWNHRFPNCLYSVSYEIIVFDNLFLVRSICSHISLSDHFLLKNVFVRKNKKPYFLISCMFLHMKPSIVWICLLVFFIWNHWFGQFSYIYNIWKSSVFRLCVLFCIWNHRFPNFFVWFYKWNHRFCFLYCFKMKHSFSQSVIILLLCNYRFS